ncbi:uncharacterized protein LOC113550914 [Rhopalosiphum maidis]|uniref:uncharacterized protein LOC113550914 n=1 Tax=Rhopalosiphum maidis TaxID=43146 RepID=UPI000F001519|nr:uncharacterized protein LOC113550914 [Rhopalosiphum maidis]
MVDYTLYRRFNEVYDHRQGLLSESYPRHSVDFLSAFRNVRQNCTAASSPSPSSPSCTAEHMDVEGKCALVVDGTSGVGFAFADELLKMKAAKVVITGLDEHKGAETACELNERYGPAKADFYQADTTSPLDVESNILFL